MIDEPFRQWLARRASAPAAALARAGITANQITVVAAVLGLTAAALVAVQLTGLGIALWLVSRLLDGFDGIVARLSGQSSLFGGYLDITLDMLAYSAMAIAFAIAMPADVVLWMLVLLGYVLAITTTLALSKVTLLGQPIWLRKEFAASAPITSPSNSWKPMAPDQYRPNTPSPYLRVLKPLM